MDECPADEFLDWSRLQGIEPWGHSRDDVNAALIRESVLAPWAKNPISAGDLIPKWGGTQPLDEDTRKARWEASVSAFTRMALAMKSAESQ